MSRKLPTPPVSSSNRARPHTLKRASVSVVRYMLMSAAQTANPDKPPSTGSHSCCHHPVDDALIRHASATASAASTAVAVIKRQATCAERRNAGSTNRRSRTYCESGVRDRHVRTER